MISGHFIRHTLFILCAVRRGCRAGWVRCVRWRSPRWLTRCLLCSLAVPRGVFFLCVCVCWGTRASERGREGSRWHVAEVVGGREGGRVFPPGATSSANPPHLPRTHTGALLSLPGLSGRLSSAGDVSSPRASCVCFGFFLQDVCFTAAKLAT